MFVLITHISEHFTPVVVSNTQKLLHMLLLLYNKENEATKFNKMRIILVITHSSC